MASAARTDTTPSIADEQLLNAVVEPEKRLGVRRYFTIPGRDPFDEIEWELRDAFIPGKDKPVFEQKGVEFPKFWSQTATNIVAQKYFRGRMSSPERERSVKQMIERIVNTTSPRIRATTSGTSTHDWRSRSRNAGSYGADVPVDGVVYANETGSAPTIATVTSTFSSGAADER